MDDDGGTAAEFLWEQIAGSLDPVELHEVEKVVGASAVRESEDVYAEVRALREILSECAADTEAALATRGALGPPAVGLLQLELSQLVGQPRARGGGRRARGRAARRPEARQALDSVLGTGSRPGSTSSGRLLCCATCAGSDGGSRPSTASRPGSRLSDVEHWGGGGGGDSPFSRPQTARSAGSRRRRRRRSSRRARRRAARTRPAPTAAAAAAAAAATAARSSPRRCRGGRRSRGGTVIGQLRAALDEEREELLAQAEQLRLSIDDEHESRRIRAAAAGARPAPRAQARAPAVGRPLPTTPPTSTASCRATATAARSRGTRRCPARAAARPRAAARREARRRAARRGASELEAEAAGAGARRRCSHTSKSTYDHASSRPSPSKCVVSTTSKAFMNAR